MKHFTFYYSGLCRFSAAVFFTLLSVNCFADGPVANIKYVHDYIERATGVTVPIKTPNVTAAANVKYLLATIDRANDMSPASVATNLQSHVLATAVAIPLDNVQNATKQLFNCNAGGYYKAGNATACSNCGAGYYCPVSGNARTACTYGTSGCSGANHATDALPPMPSNPAYVTNGLIMRFDAIANAGADKHSSAWTDWYDLTGNGYNLRAAAGAAPTVNNNGVLMNSVDQMLMTAKTANLTSYSAVTVEIRYKRVSTDRGNMIFEFTPNWNTTPGGFGMSDNSESSGYVAGHCHTNSGNGPINYLCSVNDGNQHTHSNVYFSVLTATGRLMYFDGKTATNDGKYAANGSNYSAFTTAYFSVGRRQCTGVGACYNGGGVPGIEVQAFRVYSRQLTAAEVCQNAKADYARFGGTVPAC